jgi:outer membrane lipoprotein-sorting protein
MKYFLCVCLWVMASSHVSGAQREEEQEIVYSEALIDQMRDRILAFLNHLKTLQAKFSESTRKRSATGTLKLVRPLPGQKAYGKMAFVYDPPVHQEVMSRDGTIYVWNKTAKTVDETPLESTPLFMLLRSQIHLENGGREKNLEKRGNFIYWTLVPEEDSESGAELTLIFQDAPMMLFGWTLLDPQGNTTEVRLENVVVDSPLPESAFVVPKEG